MTDWVPALASFPGPRYLAFVSALEADLAAGRVKPGMRLLPQRDMAQRLDLSVGTTEPDHLFITHGGQHALSIALPMVASPEDTVLTESYTYSGMLALSAQSGYRLHGVATDAQGLVPKRLDRAFAETKARVL